VCPNRSIVRDASINEVKIQLEILTQENEARKTECLTLKEENNKLKTEVAGLKIQIQDIEQYSRRDNIEIVGIPYTPREDLYAILDTIARTIDVTYSNSDVSIVHRLPDRKKTGKPNIIVKFISRYYKDNWISAAIRGRRLTANEICNTWEATNVYINDHLTFANKRLLGHLRGLVREKKIAKAGSRSSKVFFKVKTDDPVHYVKTMEEINNIIAA